MLRELRNHRLFEIGAEVATIVACYSAYSFARVMVKGDRTEAVTHSLRLVSLEQTLGLFHEVSIQRAVSSQPWLGASMDLFYTWAYLPLLWTAALVMYLRDRELYRRYRNAFFASAVLGLVFFALMPVAPPRMLPEYGFWDSVNNSVGGGVSSRNDFAAVPSFHFGWTLLGAIGVAHVFGFNRWLVAGLCVLQAVVLLCIVSTANHFFLDAVAGAAVVLCMWALIVQRRAWRSATLDNVADPVSATAWAGESLSAVDRP